MELSLAAPLAEPNPVAVPPPARAKLLTLPLQKFSLPPTCPLQPHHPLHSHLGSLFCHLARCSRGKEHSRDSARLLFGLDRQSPVARARGFHWGSGPERAHPLLLWCSRGPRRPGAEFFNDRRADLDPPAAVFPPSPARHARRSRPPRGPSALPLSDSPSTADLRARLLVSVMERSTR